MTDQELEERFHWTVRGPLQIKPEDATDGQLREAIAGQQRYARGVRDSGGFGVLQACAAEDRAEYLSIVLRERPKPSSTRPRARGDVPTAN